MDHLAGALGNLKPRVCPSAWPGYEHVRGYTVLSLPFSSGHLLGLRVFTESDFVPYVSVWHQDPDGAWAIYNDGPSFNTTCPRWWGPALSHAALAPIRVAWTGANALRVEMESPRLVWTMAMTASPFMRCLNAVNTALPRWTWRPAVLRRTREWVAREVIGLGDISFAFVTPSGQDAVVMAEKTCFISHSKAEWEGRDLGEPVRRETNPVIGETRLPLRPAFVVAEAHARVKDPEEHRRTREWLVRGDARRRAGRPLQIL